MPNTSGLEVLFVRLYFDRHIMARLAIDLQGRGFDVLRTEEAGRDPASGEQLTFAATENRALLTFNIRDFAPLLEEWQADSRIHHGIVVSRQIGSRQYGVLLQRMLLFLNHFTSEEMVSNFVHLEQFK